VTTLSKWFILHFLSCHDQSFFVAR
jgi:hypothetical protein